jgi:hypothetical protein
MNCTLSPCNSEVAESTSAPLPECAALDALASLVAASAATSAQLRLDSVSLFSLAEAEGSYNTVPMPVLHPLVHSEHEEEIYAEFEGALSERLRATSRHLKHSRDTMSREVACCDALSTQQDLPDTEKHQLEPMQTSSPHVSFFPHEGDTGTARPMAHHTFHSSTWQARLALVGFGLMCLLAGFDTMGLLMLHLH